MNVSEIADAMVYLASNEEERRKMGDIGFKIIREANHVLVLHRVKQEGDLIEVGDDVLADERINEGLDLPAP